MKRAGIKMNVTGNRLKWIGFGLGGRRWICAMMVAIGLLQAVLGGEVQHVSARITYRIEEGVYVDVGTDKQLRKGVKGRLVFEDGRSVVFEVMQSTQSSALLHIDGYGTELDGSFETLPVDLVFESVVESENAPVEENGAAIAVAASESEPFVPLLAPLKQTPTASSSGNISHGNVGVRQSMLTGTDSMQDRWETRLYTSGSIDRLLGSGWSFNWSGNARYRSGDGYDSHPEYETIQPLVYRAMLQHPLDAGGFVRLGRFLPLELPGIGYIDGGQIEFAPGTPLRFGVVAGLKPNSINLEVTADEPTVAGYATLEAGKRGAAYYSGTAGLLASLYQGEANRLAFLFDQRASLGPRLDLYSSAEIDMGVADTTNSKTQLSRFDLTVSSRISRNNTVRAGADHWQQTDTPSVRDRLEVVDDSLFDNGYWRYWVGGSHNLFWRLNLNEEVAYTVSDATDNAMRWRVGLTRTGIFRWSNANIAATIYNLEAQDASGYGGLLSAYFPFRNGCVTVRPLASMRWLDPDNGGDGLSLSYYSVYLDARLSRSWLLTGGLTETMGDGADSTLIDLGLRYNW